MEISQSVELPPKFRVLECRVHYFISLFDRKVERFLSQPFFVAEIFTGSPGKYVSLEQTIKGFEMVFKGELDDLPEQAFYLVGNIDEAIAKAETLK